MTFSDFLFRDGIDQIDPDVAELIRHETARQQDKLIMIPSESTAPFAVRDALSSSFHNLYAEGYPLANTRHMTQAQILDYDQRLPEFRRNADQRYYKGTEYVNILEALARRRAAEVFQGNGFSPDELYVNVQPLSGAPANNAVYSALLDVGDTVMGMDLIMGGHLTHGSPVNRSGINYNIVSYSINPATKKLDYEQMMQLALEHKPRLIIGGFSSYPYAADWDEYRKIADAAGAYLLADVAHVAGLIAAGVYPNPVGIADVVSFTTHKTLNGPRGAVLITHRANLARKLDRAVFPGEQGGPHINAMAGLAVALRLATTEQFRDLQAQTLVNAERLAAKLEQRGFRLPHGGTDTHLLLLDCKSIVGADGTQLSGDIAARILDLAGVVVNRQTIPGDASALRPSGIRLGTTWLTQRGISASQIDQLGDIIADVLDACLPFSLTGRIRPLARAKVDFDVLQDAQRRAPRPVRPTRHRHRRGSRRLPARLSAGQRRGRDLPQYQRQRRACSSERLPATRAVQRCEGAQGRPTPTDAGAGKRRRRHGQRQRRTESRKANIALTLVGLGRSRRRLDAQPQRRLRPIR